MVALQSLRGQVRSAMAEGDYERALLLVRAIQSRFPEDFETTVLLAEIHLEKGSYQDARDAFRAVLEVDPENLLARSALAVIAEEEGDLSAALAQFERAFDIDPFNGQIGAEIHRLRSQLGQTRAPEPGSSMHAAARRLVQEKKYEEAIVFFDAALRVEPDAAEAAVGMAETLWLVGRVRSAEEAAREILVDHPNCLKALAILAGAALFRGDTKGVSLLERTGELNPGNAVAAALLEAAGLALPAVVVEIEVPDAVVEQEGEEPSQPDERAAVPGSPGGRRMGSPRSGGKRSARGAQGGAPRARDGASEAGAGSAAAPTLRAEGGTEEAPGAEVEERAQERSEPEQVESRGGLRGKMRMVDRSTEQQGRAALHISFARSFEARGEIDLALAEYRTALQLDASAAATIGEAALAMANSDPANLKARWLAGDALAIDGQFRRALEQYLIVMGSGGGSAAPVGQSSGERQVLVAEKEQDGTDFGDR